MRKRTLFWIAVATTAGIAMYRLRKRKVIRESEKDRCRPFNRVSPGWEYML